MTTNQQSNAEAMQYINLTLPVIHRINTGKVSNKWTSYLDFYEDIFSGFRGDELKLLEIGVQNGGSLETWSKYFPYAKSITGCDIDEKCNNLAFDDSRISIVVGDANSQDTFDILSKNGPYEIIIDDGSHLSEDILVNFLNYFPHVSPGGTYVIEDTHAIYQREQTNIKSNQSALKFFKDLTDVINYQFWFTDSTIAEHLSPQLSIQIPSFILDGWIDSIEFRNSVIVIKKSLTPTHQKVGSVCVSGNIAIVDDTPLRVYRSNA